jgi:hypothetical protein
MHTREGQNTNRWWMLLACTLMLALVGTAHVRGEGSTESAFMTIAPAASAPNLANFFTRDPTTTSLAAMSVAAVQGYCGDGQCNNGEGETCMTCGSDCNPPLSCAEEGAQCGYIWRCSGTPVGQQQFCGNCWSGQQCQGNVCVNCEPIYCSDDNWCPTHCMCQGSTCVDRGGLGYCYWGC